MKKKRKSQKTYRYLYFHSNAFAFNPQTHLCFYTYLIKFEEEAVKMAHPFFGHNFCD